MFHWLSFLHFLYLTSASLLKECPKITFLQHLISDIPENSLNISLFPNYILSLPKFYSVNAYRCHDYRHYLFDKPLLASKHEQKLAKRLKRAALVWQKIYKNIQAVGDFTIDAVRLSYANLWLDLENNMVSKFDTFSRWEEGEFMVLKVREEPYGVVYPQTSFFCYSEINLKTGYVKDMFIEFQDSFPRFIFDIPLKAGDLLPKGKRILDMLFIGSPECKCGKWMTWKPVSYTADMIKALLEIQPTLFSAPPKPKLISFLRCNLFQNFRKSTFIPPNLASVWTLNDSLQMLKDLWPNNKMNFAGITSITFQSRSLIKEVKKHVLYELPSNILEISKIQTKAGAGIEDFYKEDDAPGDVSGIFHDYLHHFLIYSVHDKTRILEEQKIWSDTTPSKRMPSSVAPIYPRHFAFSTGILSNKADFVRQAWTIESLCLPAFFGYTTTLYFHLFLKIGYFDYLRLGNVMTFEPLVENSNQVGVGMGFIPFNGAILVDIDKNPMVKSIPNNCFVLHETIFIALF